jgi:hypothetical protein
VLRVDDDAGREKKIALGPAAGFEGVSGGDGGGHKMSSITADASAAEAAITHGCYCSGKALRHPKSAASSSVATFFLH